MRPPLIRKGVLIVGALDGRCNACCEIRPSARLSSPYGYVTVCFVCAEALAAELGRVIDGVPTVSGKVDDDIWLGAPRWRSFAERSARRGGADG